jgi:hypothetical protein
MNRLRVRRLAGGGTAHVSGDYAASGWGTAPTVTPSARDTGGRVTIVAGTGPSANPSITLTFKDGTYTTAPAVVVSRGDAASPSTGTWILNAVTATTMVAQFIGTPVAASSYVLDFLVVGK